MLQNDCRQVKSDIGVFVVAEIISDSFHLCNWIKRHIFPITVFFRQLRYKILHHSNYYFTFNDNTLKTWLILNICDPIMENNPNKNVNTALEWKKKTRRNLNGLPLFFFFLLEKHYYLEQNWNDGQSRLKVDKSFGSSVWKVFVTC